MFAAAAWINRGGTGLIPPFTVWFAVVLLLASLALFVRLVEQGDYLAAAADDPAVDMHLQNLARARFDSRQISYRDSVLQDLRAVGRPVQVLLGTADPLIFPSLAARQSALQQAAPDMRVDTILGAGHWLPYEAPDAVNDALLTFHLRGDPHAV